MRELVNLMTAIDQSEDDLIAQMKGAIDFRRRCDGDVVTTCCSFDHDHREVWEIPEFQTHCKRLVEFGFIGVLISASTCPYLNAPPHLLNSPFLGAFEVWAHSLGLFQGGQVTMPQDEAAKMFWIFQSMVLPIAFQMADSNMARFPHIRPASLHVMQF